MRSESGGQVRAQLRVKHLQVCYWWGGGALGLHQPWIDAAVEEGDAAASPQINSESTLRPRPPHPHCHRRGWRGQGQGGGARPPPELQLVLGEDRGCYMCSVCGPGWLGWRVVRLVRGRLPGPDWPPAAGLVLVVAPRQLGGSTHEPRL